MNCRSTGSQAAADGPRRGSLYDATLADGDGRDKQTATRKRHWISGRKTWRYENVSHGEGRASRIVRTGGTMLAPAVAAGGEAASSRRPERIKGGGGWSGPITAPRSPAANRDLPRQRRCRANWTRIAHGGDTQARSWTGEESVFPSSLECASCADAVSRSDTSFG